MWGMPVSKSKKRIVAVADIGSESAAVAIVQLGISEKSIILASHRTYLSHADRDIRQTSTSVLTALKEAGTKTLAQFATLKNKNAQPPRDLYVCMRAPWSHSATRQVYMTFPKTERITAKTLENLSKEALSAEKDINTERLLEASLTRIEINGYPTAAPIGKEGTSIRATILLSDINPELKKSAEDSLASIFPSLKPVWRSHIRALMTLLRERPGDSSDSVILDIATDSCSALVVRDGVIAEQADAREGTKSILSRISAGGMPEETLSLMKMVEQDMCTSPQCDILRENLGKAELELVRVFAEPLSVLASQGRLPTRFLLFTISEIAPWLARFFSRIDFSQFTTTAQPFTPTVIGVNDMKSLIEANPGVTIDTSLALACALVHIENSK
jgi:hypothetical protein